jgi:hypothetical protein
MYLTLLGGVRIDVSFSAQNSTNQNRENVTLGTERNHVDDVESSTQHDEC